MAFPGGGIDEIDEGDSLNTAIRETREEVGLLLNKNNLIEKAPTVRPYRTFHEMELELVPYVFAQDFDIQDLSPCQIEVKKVISVPFQLFLDESNYRKFSSIDNHWGCDVWDGPPVWGLTLDIILQFITEHSDLFTVNSAFLNDYKIRRSKYLD